MISKKFNNHFCLHKSTETLMLIIGTSKYEDEILIDCVCMANDNNKIFFSNVTYTYEEIEILDINFRDMFNEIIDNNLKKGTQLSFF